jgi:hypothetical protein
MGLLYQLLMIGVHRTFDGIVIGVGKLKCVFVDHNGHMSYPGIEPGHPQ